MLFAQESPPARYLGDLGPRLHSTAPWAHHQPLKTTPLPRGQVFAMLATLTAVDEFNKQGAIAGRAGGSLGPAKAVGWRGPAPGGPPPLSWRPPAPDHRPWRLQERADGARLPALSSGAGGRRAGPATAPVPQGVQTLLKALASPLHAPPPPPADEPVEAEDSEVEVSRAHSLAGWPPCSAGLVLRGSSGKPHQLALCNLLYPTSVPAPISCRRRRRRTTSTR